MESEKEALIEELKRCRGVVQIRETGGEVLIRFFSCPTWFARQDFERVLECMKKIEEL